MVVGEHQAAQHHHVGVRIVDFKPVLVRPGGVGGQPFVDFQSERIAEVGEWSVRLKIERPGRGRKTVRGGNDEGERPAPVGNTADGKVRHLDAEEVRVHQRAPLEEQDVVAGSFQAKIHIRAVHLEGGVNARKVGLVVKENEEVTVGGEDEPGWEVEKVFEIEERSETGVFLGGEAPAFGGEVDIPRAAVVKFDVVGKIIGEIQQRRDGLVIGHDLVDDDFLSSDQGREQEGEDRQLKQPGRTRQRHKALNYLSEWLHGN